MPALTIGARQFPTKTAATAHYRALLDRWYGRGPVAGDDAREIYDLASRVYRDRLRELGAARFEVASDGRGSRCAWVVTHAGARWNFSIHNCLNGRRSNEHERTYRAARWAVEPDIAAFRDQAFDRVLYDRKMPACAICLAPLNRAVCHVDHRAPLTFMKLWQAFTQENPGADLETEDTGLSGAYRFANQETTAAWRAFHTANARLRLLHASCHLRLKKGGVDGD